MENGQYKNLKVTRDRQKSTSWSKWPMGYGEKTNILPSFSTPIRSRV